MITEDERDEISHTIARLVGQYGPITIIACITAYLEVLDTTEEHRRIASAVDHAMRQVEFAQ